MASEWSGGEPPAGADAELRELEDELCRLTGVLAVGVVGDRAGRPVEIHVLSDHAKPAKQIVRDVRAVARTVFGLELDHRVVSVAQLEAGDASAPSGVEQPRSGVRPRVGGVHVDTEGVRAQARVTLGDGESEATGFAEGSIASVARPHLIASATLDALRQLQTGADAIHLDSAQITRAGSSRVAIVTVV